MGNCCCRKRSPRGRIVLLLLGLDNAGKTVAVQNLTGERTQTVMPTVGFSIVDLKYSKFDVKVFDLGGRPDFRDVWHRYFVDAHGIIFVIDSSDYDRIEEAQEVLKNIVSNPKIKGKPLLVLANKQDNQQALDEIDLIDKLDLESLANDNECPTFIQSCFANDEEKVDNGIKVGYNWLVKRIIGDYKQLQTRVQEDVKCQLKLDEEERKAKFLRIQHRHEQEALAQSKIQPSNGIHDPIVLQEASKVDVQSISSTSTEIESIRSSDDIVHEIIPRPPSATSAIRKQLELGNLKRRSSLQITNNKISPIHVFGVPPKTPKTVKSATVRQSATSGKLPDRRHLRSAGDSVFIVPHETRRVMPNDGSGDLYIFNSERHQVPLRQLSVVKDVLPPINDIQLHRPQNGTYF